MILRADARHIPLRDKSERYYFDQEAVKEDGVYAPGITVTGSLAQFGRNEKLISAHAHRGSATPITSGKRNVRSVWCITTNPYSGAHFATFPREIPERCIKAGSRPGDVILDPFCGSGTTVMVAQDLGRIGIGLDLTYQELAAERIGGSLFKGVVNSAWQ